MSEVLDHVPFLGSSDRLWAALFVFEKNPLAVLGHGPMRRHNVHLQRCVGCKPIAAQHAVQGRGQPRFRWELVQVCAIDLGAWYITHFVAFESPEDAFAVRAHEIFVDDLVEFA